MGNQIVTGLFAPADEFEGEESNLPLMGATVHIVRVYAKALIWINILLAATAVFISLVPGAALGGAPVAFAAMPHIVWLVPTLLALAYALDSTGFDSHFDVQNTLGSLVAALVFMCISILFNIVHLIALVIECVDKTSIFYVQGFPFLLTMTIGTGIFILWQAWICARLWVYRSTIESAVTHGWVPGMAIDAANLPMYNNNNNNKDGYTQLPQQESFEKQAPASQASATATPSAAPSLLAKRIGSSVIGGTRTARVVGKTE